MGPAEREVFQLLQAEKSRPPAECLGRTGAESRESVQVEPAAVPGQVRRHLAGEPHEAVEVEVGLVAADDGGGSAVIGRAGEADPSIRGRCDGIRVVHREVVVAITNGRLDFGPWEQIFYGEFDGRRPKRVLVKIIGA